VILRWNGSAWTRAATPRAGQILERVAVTSARSAWAVGGTVSASSSSHAVILRWNGTAWRRVPAPPGTGLLDAVTPSGRPWAVGLVGSFVTGKRTPAIIRWNGTAWTRVRLPAVGSGLLTSAAVTSARNAWAVGATGPITRARTLILRWNGTRWTVVPS
jgi:hypothetical protein